VDQLLGSVELQFTLVEDTVLKRLAEPIELQGGDPAKQKIKARLLCLTKPAIRSFEGHAFYDRLLLLALTVFIWYFHLSRDTNNDSATVSLYWTEAGLLPLSLELGLLTLSIVLGNLAGVLYFIVVIAYAEFRGYFGRIHLRLPVRNMEHL
jgi:hypothetical protein